MSKIWFIPLTAVLGAASLSVWAQANAGPPPLVSPGVIISNIDANTKSATAEDSPKPDDPPLVPAGPTPTAGISAVPELKPEPQYIPAEPLTMPPSQVTHTPNPSDDKGGLRQRNASDDAPGHHSKDDKGGLR